MIFLVLMSWFQVIKGLNKIGRRKQRSMKKISILQFFPLKLKIGVKNH